MGAAFADCGKQAKMCDNFERVFGPDFFNYYISLNFFFAGRVFNNNLS